MHTIYYNAINLNYHHTCFNDNPLYNGGGNNLLNLSSGSKISYPSAFVKRQKQPAVNYCHLSIDKPK